MNKLIKFNLKQFFYESLLTFLDFSEKYKKGQNAETLAG